MAYDARIAELNSRYTGLIGKIPAAETNCIKSAIDAYTSARNDKLPSLVLYVTSTTDIAIGDSFRPKLKDTREALDLILKDMFRAITDQSSLSSEALAFQGTARVEDDFFFGGLEGLGLDTARDRILSVSAGLQAYIAVLDAKWSSTLEKDTTIEQQEEQLMRDLNDAARKTIEEGSGAANKYAPVLADFVADILNCYKDMNTIARKMIVDYIEKNGDKSLRDDAELWAAFFVTVLDPVKWVKSVLTPKMDADLAMFVDAVLGQVRAGLPLVNGFFAERVGKIRDLVATQGTVMVIFSDTRKEADEFVRTHGLNIAKETFDSLSSGLESWYGRQMNANQSDASAIKTEIIGRYRERVDKLADAFNEFVRNYNGKFFSTVSSSVETAFVNSAGMRVSGRRSPGDSKKSSDFITTVLSKFTPDLRNAFDQVGDTVASLPLPLQTRFKDAVLEVQSTFLEKVTAKVEEAKAANEQLTSTVRVGELKRVIDRRPLLSLMRG